MRPISTPHEDTAADDLRAARTFTALDLIKDEPADILTLVAFVFCLGFMVVGCLFAIGAHS